MLRTPLRTRKWNIFRGSLFAAVTATSLLLSTSNSAFAHGGGVIRLASNQVAVGGTLGLTGEKLEKNSNIRLELRGTLDNYPVGEVKTDTAGKFQMSIVLPPHVPAGAYTLVGIAADGDVTARADLTVGTLTGGAGSGPVAGMQGMSGMNGTQEMPGMHATDEMMALKRTTSGGEWAFIAAFVIATFAGGAVLLRKAASMGHG
ncbi:MAG: hypothetical protein ACR2MQ_08145 [Gemmatimonadaceae bacterium]